MKTHQEYIDAEETPNVGDVFDFYGMRVKTIDAESCSSCVRYTKKVDDCEVLPHCGGVTFVYDGMNDSKRFKVWRVIRRIDEANGL